MTRGQLQAVLWLRWRLTVNQWRRRGRLEAFLGSILILMAGLLGLSAFLAGTIGGAMILGGVEPTVVVYIWLGVTLAFLLCWGTGLLSELERSEVFDLQRLLHLPVPLGGIFVANYLASLFSLTLLTAGPAMLGLALGGALARGPVMLGMVPLALAYVLAVTTATYWARGSVAGWLTNPRRRRAAAMAAVLLVVGAMQVPGLYLMKSTRDARERPKPARRAESNRLQPPAPTEFEAKVQAFIAAQPYVPLLWLPAGAHDLAAGRAGPAILFTLGCLAVAVLSLHRAYRGTLRFYRGETDARAATLVRPRLTTGPPGGASKLRLVERSLPAIPAAAAAVALATLRSNLRAVEVRMGFAGLALGVLSLAGVAAFAPAPKLTGWQAHFAPTAALLVAVAMSATFLLNVFGLDRQGFRATVLSPIARRQVLLGKNLAWLVFCGPASLLLALAGCIFLQVPAAAAMGLVLQYLALLALALSAGNLISILSPVRVDAGSLGASKQSTKAALLQLFYMLLFPIALSPVFVAPGAGWWSAPGGGAGRWADLLASAAVLGAAGAIYRGSLGPLGRLLQRREQRILEVVTAQVE
jgi:ABC-2 type transport system permease protein